MRRVTAFLAACGLTTGLWAGEPAPVNSYNGMQEREEVFKFTQKPNVKKVGDKWTITFTSKANCDATVAIVDKDGKIVRHLASGVLGKNAPWPFQQNSLSQRIEWDGFTDDFKKAPEGCRVKVSLGLKATFERNLAYDPNETAGKVLVGTGQDGSLYVLSMPGRGSFFGRVYDKDGKYVRTFWPPAAKDLPKLGKLGYRFATTTWGDKTLVAGWFGPFVYQGDGRGKPASELGKAMFASAGITDYKEANRPAALPAPRLDPNVMRIIYAKISRIWVDDARAHVYAGYWGAVRFNATTGELDETWAKLVARQRYLRGVHDMAFGRDGLIYIRAGEHARWVIRMDRDGTIVPFKVNTLPAGFKPLRKYGTGGVPPQGGLVTGSLGSGNTYMNGFDVTEDGTILLEIHSWIVESLRDPNALQASVADSNKAKRAAEELGVRFAGGYRGRYFITVWDNDGKPLTRDAIEGRGIGDGAYMDRDGNIYMVQGGVLPAGQDKPEGIADVGTRYRRWGGCGSLIKFRGLGGKYPVGKFYGKIPYGGETKTPRPPGALKLSGSESRNTFAVTGALWVYGGVSNQSFGDCNCAQNRFHLDHWARSWIPANHLCSVIVLDSNGNRIARIGRYGNPDDPGVRFAWLRAAAASDTALYVCDHGNRRILKAELAYHAEETAPLP